MITANSSPPIRQATSTDRTASRSRSAAWARTRSPARCDLVVDRLEVVEVEAMRSAAL
jgi:hypothetical protein